MNRMVRINRLLSLILIVIMLVAHFCPAYASSVSAKVSSSSANFYHSPSSSSSHVDISKGAKVKVTAVKDGGAKVKYKGVTGYMKTSALSKATKKKSWKSKVVALKWYDGGSSAMSIGEYGTLYDIHSGTSIRIKRMGGHNHADVEPATKKDTAKLAKLGYSWNARPAILRISGHYIACSFNTKPHGDQTLTSNGYNGQFCLHMVGSKTHGTGSVNSDHQHAIASAYDWAH